MIAPERLPALLDVKQLRAELGVTRAAAEAIMRQAPSRPSGATEDVLSGATTSAATRAEQTFAKTEIPV